MPNGNNHHSNSSASSVTKEFLESDVMKKMAPAKRAILEQLILQSNTGSVQDAFPVLMAAQASLQGQGLSFTPEEIAAITQILTSRMSPEEKKKLQILKKFCS